MKKSLLIIVFVLLALVAIQLFDIGMFYIIAGFSEPFFLLIGSVLCLLGGRICLLAYQRIKRLFVSSEKQEITTTYPQQRSHLFNLLDRLLIICLGFVILVVMIYALLVLGIGHSFRGDEIYADSIWYWIGFILLACIILIGCLWKLK